MFSTKEKQFQEIWNRSSNVNEVCRETNQTKRAACSMACRLRKNGLSIKKMPFQTMIPIKDRFFALVEKTDSCWIWTGSKNRKGYGQIQSGKRGQRPLLAHRVSWIIHVGPISEGSIVCHTCDNPCCVNPLHLEIGSHQKNTEDMVDRKRGVGQENQPFHLWQVEAALADFIWNLV